MKKWIDVKSVVIGVLAAVSLSLLIGAAGGGGSAPAIGRFRITAVNDNCFIIDTATGQTWVSYHEGFYEPKLKNLPTSPATSPEGRASR
jgi:hypothetical protein